MEKRFQFPMARSPQPIRITMPAAVAYDLGALQKGIAGLVEKLGCSDCCSGFDITLLHERNFIINEKLEISPVRRSTFGPSPDPWLPQDPIPIRVTLPVKIGYNLEQVQEVLAKVAGKLGCEACCSGFDLALLQERELLFDEALNIHSL